MKFPTKQFISLSLLGAALLGFNSMATAQVTPPGQFGVDNPVLQRARNLARQAGERANGGLTRYRAEASMHGPASESPFVDNGDNTFTFTFLGGAPAQPPTIETVVTVAYDASTITVDYNGPIRTTEATLAQADLAQVELVEPAATTIPDMMEIQRGMNLARQAAEAENGGLSAYRAEMAMYDANLAPWQVNPDGSLTFNFYGAPPEAAIATVQSIVTVSADGSTVTVDYNGPVETPMPSDRALN